MVSVVGVLALIAGLLALISLFPAANQYPLLNVSILLLAIALYLSGGH